MHDSQLIQNKRFIGGMNIDRLWGRNARTNATVPLATMRASDEEIEIAAIPPFRRFLPSVTVPRSEVTAVYRSLGLILTPGVGVEAGSSTHYFWTWRGATIVKQLVTMGYPTSAPRRPSLFTLVGRRPR